MNNLEQLPQASFVRSLPSAAKSASEDGAGTATGTAHSHTNSNANTYTNAYETTTQSHLPQHHNNHYHENQSSCNDMIDRMLQAVESRQGYAHSNSGSVMFTDDELKQLSSFSTLTLEQFERVRYDGRSLNDRRLGGSVGVGTGVEAYVNPSENSWSNVDIESLIALCSILESQVRASLVVDVIQEARSAFDSGDKEWNNHRSRDASPAQQLSATLRRGLQAATILLSVMISPSVDRRVINEESIDAIVRCLRNHIGNHIIPALGNIGHTASYAPKTRSSGASANSSQTTTKKKKKDSEKATPSKKSRTSQQDLIKFLKRTYKPIWATIGIFTNLMERLDLLIQYVAIDDQPLYSVCATALSTLTIDPSGTSDAVSWTHAIQSSSINIITAAFRKYPQNRVVVLEDLFPLFLKIPTSKKSIRTYEVAVGSAMNATGMTNSDRLSGRGYSSSMITKSRDDEGESGVAYIQVMTALVLSLIQSCVTMPHSLQEEHSHRGDGNDGREGNGRLTSGLLECERVCDMFTSFLIQRCAKKGGDGGASEFRPILANLVEDLLLVQILPVYPAAEMLLVKICRKLCHDLMANSCSSGGARLKKSAAAEVTYLSTAMDTIGNICSDIAAKIACAKESPLEFPKAVDMDNVDDNADPSNNSEERNRCFCGRDLLVDTFMLDCDRCHNWFHGSCIGFAKDNLPENWICDECTMQLLVHDQMKIFSSKYGQRNEDRTHNSLELTGEDKIHMMRILLLNYLTRQSKPASSSNVNRARQFHLAKFIQDSNTTKECPQLGSLDIVSAYYLDIWANPDQDLGHESTANGREKCEYLSKEGNAKLMLTLNASKSELIHLFPRLLGMIISLMKDRSTGALRKLAIKALSQIVQGGDSSVMTTKSVREAVAERFQDEATSVREAAVSLVGFYVLQFPSLAKSFHEPLLQRLSDTGVSVRKRAVKIFRDLISTNPSYPKRAFVFSMLLQKAADRKEDDGVRDLIHETFMALWFANYKSFGKTKSLAKTRKSIAAVVTPVEDIERCRSSTAHETAKQLVEVVSTSTSQEPLIKLVQDILNGQGDKIEGKKAIDRKIDRNAAECYCESVVSYLIEELVTFEEERCSFTKNEGNNRLVSLLTTLHVFAEASPSLLLRHYDTLLYYLKTDARDKPEQDCVICICKILCQVVKCFRQNDLQRLGQDGVAADLVNIIYSFGISATSAAVEALAKLATHPLVGKNSPLMKSLVKLARRFYSHLAKMKDTANDLSQIKTRDRVNVHRALMVLGCISRFHDFTSTVASDEDLAEFVTVNPSELTWENFPSACFALFEVYLEKLDTATKCKSLRAMSGIFSAHPRIMLAFEQRGILKKIMSDDSHRKLQEEALICWRDILICEEKRVESGEAKRQMESKDCITTSKKVSGDQDGDASLIGACCIQQASRLYEMTSSPHQEIRFHSVLLIETLTRQGLLNPMQMIPYLFALQGDLKNPQIRELARKILAEEAEKRPSSIRLLVAKGIEKSYHYQRNVYPDIGRPTALIIADPLNEKAQQECIFDSIFRESIRSSRNHSARVIKSLLKLFSEEEKKDEVPMPLIDKAMMLSFASEVIAYLPYNHLGDVLCIIHNIDGLVTLEGPEIMTKFTEFFRPHGLSDDDGDHRAESIFESAALKSKPSSCKGLKAMKRKSFDATKFSILCLEASSMLLLLRLDKFLRESYSGVTTTRVVEYNPNEKERISDRGASRSSTAVPFNSEIPIPLSSKSTYCDLDDSIRFYAELLLLMRDYDSRQEILSESSSEEKKNSKRKRSFDEDY